MHKIDIHADDYCLSPHTSENILDCIRAEKLDSISVITNMSCFERYARKLKDERYSKSTEVIRTFEFYGRALSGRER